jgi:hypothetical protein
VRARLALAVALAAAATPAVAQSRLSVSVAAPSLATRTVEGPSIALSNLFADSRSTELLESGFPARITVVVELWAGRTLFDNLLRSDGYQRVVRFEPLSATYRVARVTPDTIIEEGRYASLDAVRAFLGAPVKTSITAPAGRRALYYTAHATVETFSSNDLAEVQRWLNGDAQPVLRGEKNPISALKRGVLTVFSRLLGGDVKRANGRSAVFETAG